MDAMTPAEKTTRVRELAAQAGFARSGVAPAGPIARVDYFRDWLAKGCAGSMEYMARWKNQRVDPRSLLEGAKSIIVVAWQDEALAGGGVEPMSNDVLRGRVARYAWGRDYHRVVRKRLRHLADRVREAMDEPLETRVCVDTAPIVEREWAAAAGIGWIGRNTMVIDSQIGSMFMLGEILTTLELEPTTPAKDRCGDCMRCVEACPTGALTKPYQMDASRCISYLTIEHRGEISKELSRRMGNWVFGCDVCQEVCPWNRHAARPSVESVNTRNPLVPSPPLADLCELSADQYNQFLRGSAMKRATLEMLKRNARIALANHRRDKKGDGTAE